MPKHKNKHFVYAIFQICPLYKTFEQISSVYFCFSEHARMLYIISNFFMSN